MSEEFVVPTGSDATGTWMPGSSVMMNNSMLEKEQLLVMFGFVNSKGKEFYEERIKGKTESQKKQAVINIGAAKCKEFANQERSEVVDGGWSHTGYPDGAVRYHLVLESATEGVEDSYYDVLERCRTYFGFPLVYKVTDYFAASENSAFFGNSQQRIGIQQDRVQQFLANIGKFVKELFQMVRELRIIDERLAAYEAAGGVGSKHANDRNFKHSQAADVSLKSIFTDLVEGGTKNPQSVFGLAQQVGFTLLPDLFFNEYVARPEDIDARVDAMPYNKSVKSVLKRKLYQYLVWKEKTYAELMSKRRFNIKYLRQHWTIIKMYMAWVKPYLRNIQRLTMNSQYQESPDLIAAFEGSYIEVEFIAAKPAEAHGGYHPVILASFAFRTRPDMNARKEYQVGPMHLGRMDLNLRAYAWTPQQLEKYRELKRREEIELLGILDSHLVDVMDSLGAEFENYLKEAGEETVEKITEKPSKKKKTWEDSGIAPFVSVFAGFKEIGEAFIPVDMFKSSGSKSSSGSPSKAHGAAVAGAFLVYQTYKKSRRMTTW